MSYFSAFPSLSYAINRNDLSKLIIAKDITVRAKISEYFKNAAITSLPYEIQDGERPETLSHRVYDRSDLHWLILLFNEVMDPTFEWPLSSQELESHIAQKYKGYSIYYPDTSGIPDEFQLQDTTTIANAKTLHQVLSGGNTISASIIKWSPSYNELVIDGDEAEDFDPSFVPPESTDGYARAYFDGDTTKTIAFAKKTPYEYGVNHFEDSDGNELNPRPIPDLNSPNPQWPSSLINRYVTGVDYIQPLDITNRVQEFRDNDEKRLIRVIKPEFIGPILSQFRTIFK